MYVEYFTNILPFQNQPVRQIYHHPGHSIETYGFRDTILGNPHITSYYS